MFSPEAIIFPLVELEGWKLGLLICYDLEFPENARRLALAGAELILVPTANMVPFDFVADVTVRARAFENQCYVAYANYCGHEGDPVLRAKQHRRRMASASPRPAWMG
jgi:predicted amidohydrolase